MLLLRSRKRRHPTVSKRCYCRVTFFCIVRAMSLMADIDGVTVTVLPFSLEIVMPVTASALTRVMVFSAGGEFFVGNAVFVDLHRVSLLQHECDHGEQVKHQKRGG